MIKVNIFFDQGDKKILKRPVSRVVGHQPDAADSSQRKSSLDEPITRVLSLIF